MMNIAVAVILALAYVAFFAFLICKLKFFKKLGVAPKWLLMLFAVKIIAAISLFGVYHFAYGDVKNGDVNKYHNGGLVLYSAIADNPLDYLKMVSGICADEPQLEPYYDKTDHWYKAWNYGLLNDNRTIMRYDAVLNLFTFGNVYLNLIISAFVAFVGAYFLALSMLKFAKGRRKIVVVSAFLIPSVVFWSSSIMKECLVMFSLGILVYSWFSLCEKFKFKYLTVALLSSVLLFLAKFYVLMALLPGLALFCIPSRLGAKKLLVSFAGVFAVIVTLFFFSGNIFGYDLVDTIVNKQHDFVNMVNTEANYAGSNIKIKELEPTFVSFASALVPAYVNVILRPFITEANSFLKLFCCFENIIFLLVFIYMCIRFKRVDNEQFKYILFMLSFLLIHYALIGMTTPNIGALVRYKIPVMPFLLFSMLLCTNFDRLKNLLSRITRGRLNL